MDFCSQFVPTSAPSPPPWAVSAASNAQAAAAGAGPVASPYAACLALAPIYEGYLSNGQVRAGLDKLHLYCLDADCAALEAKARNAVKALFADQCSSGGAKETALCDVAAAVANGAASVLAGVATFCQGGPCELVAALERVHQTPCAALAARRADHPADGACAQLGAFAAAVVDEQCRPGRNWTNPEPVGPHPIFEQSICAVVHELVLGNNFDDATVAQWDDGWAIAFAHGVFWKQADAFCGCESVGTAKCAVRQKACRTAAQAAQNEILNYCPGLTPVAAAAAADGGALGVGAGRAMRLRSGFAGSGLDAATLCTAAAAVNQHWEVVDGAVIQGYAAYRAACNGSLTACDAAAVAAARAELAARALAACNATGFDAAAAFADGDDGGGGGGGGHGPHHWARLAAQCPALVAAARAAVVEFCADQAPFECSVAAAVPWGAVPIDDAGGPVLAFLVDSVVPEVTFFFFFFFVSTLVHSVVCPIVFYVDRGFADVQNTVPPPASPRLSKATRK
jgi:hypothetical protein